MSDLSLINQSSNEPPLKPIIDPSCCRPAPEKAARKNRFTSAFIAPKPAGTLAKRGDAPLGKTYRRTTSVDRVKGPEVLPIDPRPDTRYGDGVLRSEEQRPSTFSADSSGSARTPSLWDSRASDQSTDASSILKSPQASESEPSFPPATRSQSMSHPMTHSMSDATCQSGNSTPSLRFCPLPSTGRETQRRQSISLGVASRSQLLASQNQRQSLPRGWVYTHGHGSGGPPPVRDDVVDLGEVVQKGVKKIFKRLRKDPTTLANVQERAEPSHEPPPEGRHSISIADLERHPNLAPRPLNHEGLALLNPGAVTDDQGEGQGGEEQGEEDGEEGVEDGEEGEDDVEDAHGILTPSTSSSSWANPSPFGFDSQDSDHVPSKTAENDLDPCSTPTATQ